MRAYYVRGAKLGSENKRMIRCGPWPLDVGNANTMYKVPRKPDLSLQAFPLLYSALGWYQS